MSILFVYVATYCVPVINCRSVKELLQPWCQNTNLDASMVRRDILSMQVRYNTGHSKILCCCHLTGGFTMSKDTISKILCPTCGSNAVYRDGKAHTGKQRYLCLMCGLQFTSSHQTQIHKRPLCSTCGNHMHLYKEEKMYQRFRCSQYPVCKTYAKVPRQCAAPTASSRHVTRNPKKNSWSYTPSFHRVWHDLRKLNPLPLGKARCIYIDSILTRAVRSTIEPIHMSVNRFGCT